MNEENDSERELNAGDYEHYRRKVIGHDDEGNPIFGEREPLDEDEGNPNSGDVDAIIAQLDGLDDEELEKVQRETMRCLYGLGTGLEEAANTGVEMPPIDDFETDGLRDYSGDTREYKFTGPDSDVVLPGEALKRTDVDVDHRLTGSAYESMYEED